MNNLRRLAMIDMRDDLVMKALIRLPSIEIDRLPHQFERKHRRPTTRHDNASKRCPWMRDDHLWFFRIYGSRQNSDDRPAVASDNNRPINPAITMISEKAARVQKRASRRR